MRILKPLQWLCVAAPIISLSACSVGADFAIAPKPATLHARAPFPVPHVHGFFNPRGGSQIVSHYSCPATGAIEYVSDSNESVINVYSGEFAGQAPCGQIASNRSRADNRNLRHPAGLYVQATTHDLYVANFDGYDILVFHRGQTVPYNLYIDPTTNSQGSRTYPVDVTVAKDGTVIASNQFSGEGEDGSISTWIGGPDGGTFVGNFLMASNNYGGWVTVAKDGTVYYNEFAVPASEVALWKMSCPAGACGAQTNVPIAVNLQYPGGIAFDAAGNLLMSGIDFNLNTFADTYKLPDPTPTSFLMIGLAYGMAINKHDNHWFSADSSNNDAHEYAYPGGRLIGTVPGNSNGSPVGIAVDP